MRQSTLEAQEKYRRDQESARAALEAAKSHPMLGVLHYAMSADSVALLTLQAVDAMAGEVYKVHLSNPAFVARVNELETTRPPRRTRAS